MSERECPNCRGACNEEFPCHVCDNQGTVVTEYGIEDIIQELVPLIRDTLIDGQRKRSPSYWKEDPGHLDALQRHLHRYDLGERVDEDSLAHPLQHAGVRALMQAYQETHARSRVN